MSKKYHRQTGSGEGNEAQDALEIYVREGARRMLAAALEEEASAFLGLGRCQHTKRGIETATMRRVN